MFVATEAVDSGGLESQRRGQLPLWASVQLLGDNVPVHVWPGILGAPWKRGASLGGGWEPHGVEVGFACSVLSCGLLRVDSGMSVLLVKCQPRFVLIAYLLMSKGAHWTLEQPATSLMYRHKRFQEMCTRVRATCLKGAWLAENLEHTHCCYALGEFCLVAGRESEVYKQAFWMGRLGSPTPKRSILWSSSSSIWKFRRYARLSRSDKASMRKALVKYHKTHDGRKKFSGIKKNLKESQSLVQIL